MTTRYGFEGGESGGPPAAEKPRLGKTVFGRDVHLPALPAQTAKSGENAAHEPRAPQSTRIEGSKSNPQFAEAAPRPASPSTRKPTPAPSKRSQQPTQAGGKSALPGVARFLGRRNTQGDIVPLTQTDVLLPKAAWLRPAVTVAVAALGSFVLVATLLWFFAPKAPPPEPPRPSLAPKLTPPPPPPVVAAPVAEVPPVPPASPPETLLPAKRSKAKTLRPHPVPPRRPRAADPDAPLPPTFF